MAWISSGRRSIQVLREIKFKKICRRAARYHSERAPANYTLVTKTYQLELKDALPRCFATFKGAKPSHGSR